MNTSGLFKNINSEDMPYILKSLNGRKNFFKKDMTILSNLNNTNEVGIVLNGEASLIRVDYNGNRTVVSVLPKNELFGGCFSDFMNEELSVIANEDTEILFIEYDKLIGINKLHQPEQETIVNNTIEILVQKISTYNRRIEILSKKTIREKLLAYFHILEKEQSSHIVKLPFTYTVLADYIAVDRSAMMREIKNLKDEGFIKTDRKNITIIYR
jgi:CRP-like cAMP-binding protein